MSRDMMGVQEVSPGYEFVAGSPAVPLGYKQTDVGVIPEDWEIFPFGEHFSIYAGGDAPKHSLSSTQSDRHPYPVFANAIQGKGLYGFTAETRSKPDSVTVTARGYLGHAEYRSEPFFPIVRLLVLEPKGTLDSKYTSYAINDRVQFSIESTGVPQLTAPQVARYAVAAPSDVKEQKAIAVALSDVDALLEELDRLIAKKRDIKQAAMQQLLTGKTRLPGFDGEWIPVKFSSLATLSNARIDPSRSEGSDFCIELEHINQGTGLLNGSTVTTETSSLKTAFEPGDVLFGKLRAYLRKYWIANRPGVCSTEIWVLKANSQLVLPQYLFQMVTTDSFIESASTAYGTHMPRSDWKVIRETQWSIPCINEQQAIAAVLSDMDTEIQALEQRRSKTAELKQGMMQELLTGRTRLV